MDATVPVATLPPASTRAPEGRIAGDLARRALLVAPVVVALAALLRGGDGAASAGLGLGLVALNFLATAAMLAWGARRTPTALLAASLGGFLVRMGVLLGVLLAVDALFGWADMLVLGLTVFLAHLALLAWEVRSVSLTLAEPGLRRDRVTRPRASARPAAGPDDHHTGRECP